MVGAVLGKVSLGGRPINSVFRCNRKKPGHIRSELTISGQKPGCYRALPDAL